MVQNPKFCFLLLNIIIFRRSVFSTHNKIMLFFLAVVKFGKHFWLRNTCYFVDVKIRRCMVRNPKRNLYLHHFYCWHSSLYNPCVEIKSYDSFALRNASFSTFLASKGFSEQLILACDMCAIELRQSVSSQYVIMLRNNRATYLYWHVPPKYVCVFSCNIIPSFPCQVIMRVSA